MLFINWGYTALYVLYVLDSPFSELETPMPRYTYPEVAVGMNIIITWVAVIPTHPCGGPLLFAASTYVQFALASAQLEHSVRESKARL